MVNLLNRIFFDGKKELFGLSDVNKNMVIGGSEAAEIPAAAPAAPAQVEAEPPTELPAAAALPVEVSKSMPLKISQFVGGKADNSRFPYYQRRNVMLLIFLLSVFLAIITVKDPNIVKAIFKTKTVNDLSTINDKWKKMIRFTILFIAFIVAYIVALLIGVYIYLNLGSMYLNDKIPIMEKFSNIFWSYKNDVDEDVFIGIDYIIALVIVLFIVYIAYMGFSKWYPDWLESIYFQTIDKNNGKPDDTQAHKYIYYYAILIVLMMFFYLIVFDVNLLQKSKLYMSVNIIFLLGYMILALIILKEYKFGNPKKLAFIVILIVLMFILYPIVISLLKGGNETKEMFSNNFLMDLLFHFGINVK